jgi:uncharacterized protein (TIGR02996 family)
MTHDAFLQAILDAPDDETPRLVYADWLEDNGDEARGRLIRAQCAAARLDENDPRRKELEREAADLELRREPLRPRRLAAAAPAVWAT